MSSTNAPFGFIPAFHPSGQARAEAYVQGVSSGYASAIYRGQTVTLNSAGYLIAVSATNQDILGHLSGIEYIDGATLVPTKLPYWPAGQTYSGTMTAYVWDDQEIIYKVQADGSVAQANAVGNQAVISNFGAGTTPVGRSQETVSATLVGSGAQGQYVVRALDPTLDNAWGDAFTIMQVQLARPLYKAAKTAN